MDELAVAGGSNLWLFKVGTGDPRPPLEYLLPSPDMPRIEPSLDGDAEPPVSRVELARFSGSVVLSLDNPGNALLPIIDVVSDELS